MIENVDFRSGVISLNDFPFHHDMLLEKIPAIRINLLLVKSSNGYMLEVVYHGRNFFINIVHEDDRTFHYYQEITSDYEKAISYIQEAVFFVEDLAEEYDSKDTYNFMVQLWNGIEESPKFMTMYIPVKDDIEAGRKAKKYAKEEIGLDWFIFEIERMSVIPEPENEG